jgi:hypothetical protein
MKIGRRGEWMAALSMLGLAGCATTRAATSWGGGEAELVGSDTHLTVGRDDVLHGTIKGGEYDVAIEPDRAHGRGPLGPIDVRLQSAAGGYRVEGLWNGEPVSFIVTKDAIRGSADRRRSELDQGSETCRYAVERLRGRASFGGYEDCLGMPNPLRFEVQGGSSATRADQRTAVLLVAYLVAPPVSSGRS